jgi:hypothetical protein
VFAPNSLRVRLGDPPDFLEAGGFSPTDIAGLVAWYDMADTATITETAGATSQLDDKSGNGYHIVQATGTKQPTTGTRTLNSLNVLDFTGDSLVDTTFATPADWTVFAVAQVDVTAPWNCVVSSNEWEIGFYNSEFNVYGTGLNSAGVSAIDTPYILEYLYDIGVDSKCYANGSLFRTGAAPGNTGGVISIGSYRDGNSDTHNGIIAEVVIYDTVLSAGDRTSVRDYLNAKWAVY